VNRRRNYGFERRQKAQDRQARQAAKRQRKASRAEAGAQGPAMGEVQDAAAPPGTWEWFSPSRGRTLAASRGTRPDAGLPDDWILLTDVEAESDGPSVDGARDEDAQ
jgi:hypothetical protein